VPPRRSSIRVRRLASGAALALCHRRVLRELRTRPQSVLVAVIVPDADIAKQWATENSIPEEGQMAALCGNARFKAAVMAQMKSAGDTAKLKGFEAVRDIHLESELFSVDNDLLTPTFKLKRPQVRQRYLLVP
jgi:long-chain acyl-CoA synthetase